MNATAKTPRGRATREFSGIVQPALIERAGDQVGVRFLEFFTVNIRNPNTRAAYARAVGNFLRWCEDRGVKKLRLIRPVHVAAWVEALQKQAAAPTVKQHLAAVRMCFDWLVTGQAVPSNPAHSVRGPRYSVSRGSTPVLSSREARDFLKGMKAVNEDGTPYLVGLRDRAIVAAMTYTFARVGAVVALTVEDYYPRKKRRGLRLHEKNGKVNEVPCHHRLEEYLDAYLEAAGIAADRKGPLFRSAFGKTRRLSDRAMLRSDVWRMIRRRAADAGIETDIGCHTFRATGITDYLENGGRIEVAQKMAGHSNAKTTGLYDRRKGDVSLDEVERIGI